MGEGRFVSVFSVRELILEEETNDLKVKRFGNIYTHRTICVNEICL